MRTVLLAVVSGGALTALAAGPSPSAEAPEARAAALVAKMTLDEKIAMVHGTGFALNSGHAGHTTGVERLGIPALYLADGPNGVGNGSTGVTAFPAAIAVAATWDPALVERYGAALGREQGGKGHNVALAPTINILRVPHWGRTFESFSEDPYLTARVAVAEVRGIQGAGVIATAKHFAANNQETLRDRIDVKASERTLHEIYLPAFRAAVTEGGAGAVMCSYNKVGGTYACEHPGLLNDVLRREWGFGGLVMSDWFATHSTAPAARAGLDLEMPGGRSASRSEYFGASLKQAVDSGELPPSVLDTQVRRILVAMIRAGLLDRPPASPQPTVSTPDHQRLARDLAAQGAVLLKNDRGALPFDERVRSVAVIGDAAGDNAKFTGGGSAAVKLSGAVTPLAGLTARAGTVKVVSARGTLGTGPLPAVPDGILSAGTAPGVSVSYFSSPDFSGAPAATRVEPGVGGEWRQAPPAPGLPRVWSARWTGTLTPPVAGTYRFSLAGSGVARLSVAGRLVASLDSQFETIAHGLADLSAGAPVAFQLDYVASGFFASALKVGWQPPDAVLLAEAVKAAQTCDAAVVFVDDVTTESSDRATLALPGDQDRLVAAVAAANPRTVVVLTTGGPVLMPWIGQVAAVLAAWYPGQEAGHAIADVLFGDADPSGRLPVTFPADDRQGPYQTREAFPGDGTSVTYSEGLLVGYRWFDAKEQAPLFAFGHGLSYTTFDYGRLQVTRRAGARVEVRLRVTNAGKREGADVVQLYLGFPAAAGEPPRQLRGFRRVALKPGASQDVAFELDAAAMSVWDETAHAAKVPDGPFQVFVGRSSRDLPLRASVPLP